MDGVLHISERKGRSFRFLFKYVARCRSGREYSQSEHCNRFYRDWIMEKNNYNSLLNIFRYYTQAPGDLKLEIRLTEKEDGEERKQIQKKLEKGVFHG